MTARYPEACSRSASRASPMASPERHQRGQPAADGCAQDLADDPPGAEAERRATGHLFDEGERDGGGADRVAGGDFEQGEEDHHADRVVEERLAGHLDLEPLRRPRGAQHAEDGDRIGRRDDRPEQQAFARDRPGDRRGAPPAASAPRRPPSRSRRRRSPGRRPGPFRRGARRGRPPGPPRTAGARASRRATSRGNAPAPRAGARSRGPASRARRPPPAPARRPAPRPSRRSWAAGRRGGG